MTTVAGPVALITGGLAVALAVAVPLDLPARDAVEVVAIAFGAGLLALALAGLAVRRLHRDAIDENLTARAVLVALIPIVALGVGVLAAARAMFVSAHDLHVLVVVVAGAGTAGVLGALALANDMDRAHRKAADSAERERMMERSRRELVAWVSHDLRTPLAGIRAMVEALDDEVVTDPETVRRYYGALTADTDRLSRLVDDLFELSRIQADALQLVLEHVSLGDLVSDAVASASVVAESKGVHVEASVNGTSPAVLASTREMARVVRNLVDNAVRHTPPGGSVHIEVGGDGHHGVVSVTDECGGIPLNDIAHVFDVAYRGDNARSPGDARGGGLGLAIARGLIEAQAGEIDVRNHGDGCRFTVRIPVVT